MKELTTEQCDAVMRLYEAARVVVASQMALTEPLLRHRALVGAATLRELASAVDDFQRSKWTE